MTKDKLKSRLFFILVLLLGIILIVMFYIYSDLSKFEQFLPGVRIASVSVQGYNQEQASKLVEEWVNEAYNTQVVFFADDYSHKTNLGELSFPVDVTKAVQDVWNKEKHRNWKSKILNIRGDKWITYPLMIDYDSGAIQKLTDDARKIMDVKPVNASIEVDTEKGLIIIPGKTGKSVDYQSTVTGLPQEWDDFDRIEVPIISKDEYPEVNEEVLKEMGELGSFTTWYNAGDINRSHNLFLAASAINTAVIKPGGIFSFNQTVGERIYEKGYRDALIIIGGKFEPGAGGGVCQVSSTLYNACLLAGLEIVERYSHALAIAYVPLGRDATVVYGMQDFRFRNNTQYPLYIRSVAGAGKLTINIYGHLDYLQNIQLSHVVDKVIGFKEIREVDLSLEPGKEKIDHEGFPGYEVRSFRTFCDKEGKVIKSEQLSFDKYRPLNKLIYVGPPAEPVVIPEDPDPEDPDPENPDPENPDVETEIDDENNVDNTNNNDEEQGEINEKE